MPDQRRRAPRQPGYFKGRGTFLIVAFEYCMSQWQTDLTPSPRPEIRFPIHGLAATQLFPWAAPGHRGGSGGFLLECHEASGALGVIAARST